VAAAALAVPCSPSGETAAWLGTWREAREVRRRRRTGRSGDAGGQGGLAAELLAGDGEDTLAGGGRASVGFDPGEWGKWVGFFSRWVG
jgi:hypothetical protein